MNEEGALGDDEVDNGSVDTGEQGWDPITGEPNDEYDPKTINRLIRQLLNIHQKRCFVGCNFVLFWICYYQQSLEWKNC